MVNRIAAVFAAMAAAVALGPNATAHGSGTSLRIAALGTLKALSSVSLIGSGSMCAADISGTWSGILAFQTIGRGGALPVGPITSHNGTFLWEARGSQACQIMMTTYKSGAASVKLAGLSGGTVIAQATSTPSYIPWYTAPPSPIFSAYAALGGAFGASNFYNTGPNSGEIFLASPGYCNLLCYGTPGSASSNVIVFGNDVANNKSYTSEGAPDDCATKCPGEIANQVFGIAYNSGSTPAADYLAIDGNGNFGAYNNIVAGGAVIAGVARLYPCAIPKSRFIGVVYWVRQRRYSAWKFCDVRKV